MMSVRVTIIVCLLALLGVVGAVIVEHSEPSSEEQRLSEARPLPAALGIPPDGVKRIELQRRGEEAMVFELSDGQWDQLEPVRYPLDPFSIHQIVGITRDLRVVDVLEAREFGRTLTESALGLDPPQATLALSWSGGSATMQLGRKGFAGRAYLKMSGDRDVYVVNQDLHDRAVEMDPKEWRDRTIFRDIGPDAERIEIVTAEHQVALARQQRQWMMEEPRLTRVGELALEELLQALGRARVGGFIIDQPESLGRFGLEDPAGRLTVRMPRIAEQGSASAQGRETQTLLVGSRVNVSSQDRYGLVEGREVIVRIPQAIIQALFPRPEHLAAATASGVVSADVKTLRIDGPAGDFRLERDLDRWVAPDHGGVDVPTAYVEELLNALTNVRAPEVEMKPYPRDMEIATITMFGYGSRPMDTVRIAREPPAESDSEGRWALENGDDVLRIFPPSLQLRLTPGDFGLEVSAGAVSNP